MVRIDKAYRFDTDEGPASLSDLFRGNSQLLVYHFMFGPDFTAVLFIADGFNGFAVHLAHHDVTLCAVSRAPVEKLQAYKKRMGWTFPWASSFGGDFNLDFLAGCTEEQQQSGTIEYNFAPEQTRRTLTLDEGWANEIAVLWYRLADVSPRNARRQRLRAKDGASITPTPRTLADSTDCGACTSG